MKGTRVYLAAASVLALLAALATFWYSYDAYERLVATRPLVVAAQDIWPYTQITAEMVVVKEMPRGVETGAIYREVNEVVGKVAIGWIPAGALLYRRLVVEPEEFRYVDDPTLEIVAIPVDPARAVGGQIRPGHEVNVYQVVAGQGVRLVARVRVVDVRGEGGEKAGLEVRQDGGTIGGMERSYRPPKIIVVAAPPEIARELMRISAQAESERGYGVWVTLAPLR